jgi:MSHA biogenesis protein MshP
MKRQHGLGMIAAIVILVILASLAAAIVSFSSTQQMTSAQDILATRAWQAAKAGTEWGLYQALRSGDWAGAGTTCTPAAVRSATLDLTAETGGFRVSVSCTATSANEGECALADPDPACVVHPTDPTRRVKTVTLYQITAVACNSAACPAADASAAAYVERSRTVIATN